MKSTGWLFTDAVRFVECPRCGAGRKQGCRTPKGRLLFTPHCDRIRLVRTEKCAVCELKVWTAVLSRIKLRGEEKKVPVCRWCRARLRESQRTGT